MPIQHIRTKAEYEEALARIAQLMSAHAGTPQGDELDTLSTLVIAYERKHIPIESADSIQAMNEARRDNLSSVDEPMADLNADD